MPFPILREKTSVSRDKISGGWSWGCEVEGIERRRVAHDRIQIDDSLIYLKGTFAWHIDDQLLVSGV
jgi:hypothetical protein